MSFLSNILKRKPGGTFLGNLVRGTVSKFTGGILGSGAMKISQEEYDAKQRAEAAKQGMAYDPNLQAVPNPAIQSFVNTVGNVAMQQPQVQSAIWTKAKPFAIGGGVLLALGIAFAAFRPKGRRR